LRHSLLPLRDSRNSLGRRRLESRSRAIECLHVIHDFHDVGSLYRRVDPLEPHMPRDLLFDADLHAPLLAKVHRAIDAGGRNHLRVIEQAERQLERIVAED